MQMRELVLEGRRMHDLKRREEGRLAAGETQMAERPLVLIAVSWRTGLFLERTEASKDERARHSSRQRAIRGQKQLAEVREAADVEMAGVLQRAFIKPRPVVCSAVRICCVAVLRKPDFPEGEGPG